MKKRLYLLSIITALAEITPAAATGADVAAECQTLNEEWQLEMQKLKNTVDPLGAEMQQASKQHYQGNILCNQGDVDGGVELIKEALTTIRAISGEDNTNEGN